MEEETYMMICAIRIGLTGLSVPDFTGIFSIVSRTSSPPTSLPNTVCFLSRCGVGPNVRYHCELRIHSA